jgi:hypothetical protein
MDPGFNDSNFIISGQSTSEYNFVFTFYKMVMVKVK